MKLYLVRHGQSTHNASHHYQSASSPLSKDGEKQALVVAKRFKTIPVEIILASTYMRAQQTAEAIAKETGKEIIFSDDLIERVRPSILQGRHRDEQIVSETLHVLTKNLENKDWHHSDEENYYDLKDRVQRFLNLVEKRSEKDIAIVSHGITIRMIVSLLTIDEYITPHMFEHSVATWYLSNTGITVMEKTTHGFWRLVTWNDHAHLG